MQVRTILRRAGIILMIAGLLLGDAAYATEKKDEATAKFDRTVNYYMSNDITWYNRLAKCSGGAKKAGTESVILAGNDNAEKILNFFMQKGLTLAQASGFIGNMQQESGLRPDVIEGGATAGPDYVPQNGKGFGLVQWTFTARQAPLVKLADEMGKPVTDIGVQLEYVWQELNGNWKGRTLDPLKGIDDPVEAAVLIHDTYEVSADNAGKVRSVRGGAAKAIYDKYKDAPPVGTATSDQTTGETKDVVNNSKKQNKNDECMQNASNSSSGGFEATLLGYAHPKPVQEGNLTPTDTYRDKVINGAGKNGRYIGGGSNPGIDCGGFTTSLIVDSGWDKGFNYGGQISDGAGNTIKQQEWMEKNWEKLNDGHSPMDASQMQPGDVAINAVHTFIYVGKVEGFDSDIASASQDSRAPAAGGDSLTETGFTWYRKKGERV